MSGMEGDGWKVREVMGWVCWAAEGRGKVDSGVTRESIYTFVKIMTPASVP